MEIVSTQDAEVLRLEAGSLDLMVQADVRPEDYAALRRLGQQGTIALTDVGVGVDPNVLWFNLAPPPARHTPAYLQRAEFRQAISSAVDRDAIVEDGLSRRGRAGVRSGHAGQPRLVFGVRADVPVRSGARAGAARRPRARRSKRRRHARRQAGAARSLLDPHAARAHSRADRHGHPGAAPPRRHHRRRRRPRSAVDLPALERGGLRQHLLRLPGERARSGEQPGLLAQLRLEPLLASQPDVPLRRRGRRRSTT